MEEIKEYSQIYKAIISELEKIGIRLPDNVLEKALHTNWDLIPENYRSEALYYFISEDVDKALVDQIDLDILDISDFKEKRNNFTCSKEKYNQKLKDYLEAIGCIDVEEKYAQLSFSDENETIEAIATKCNFLLTMIRENTINTDSEEVNMLNIIIENAYASLREINKFVWNTYLNNSDVNKTRTTYKERAKNLLRNIISVACEIKCGIKDKKDVKGQKAKLRSLFNTYYYKVYEEYHDKLIRGARAGLYFCDYSCIEKWVDGKWTTFPRYFESSSIDTEVSIFETPYLALRDGIEALYDPNYTVGNHDYVNSYREYIKKNGRQKRLEVLSKNVIDSLDAYLNALKQFKPVYDKFVNYDRSKLYKLYGFTLYIKELLGNNSVRGYFCGNDRVQFYNVFDIIKSIDENKTTMSEVSTYNESQNLLVLNQLKKH